MQRFTEVRFLIVVHFCIFSQTTKLFVGNIAPGSSQSVLRSMFEKYGKVMECDIIKDYAFVVR